MQNDADSKITFTTPKIGDDEIMLSDQPNKKSLAQRNAGGKLIITYKLLKQYLWTNIVKRIVQSRS